MFAHAQLGSWSVALCCAVGGENTCGSSSDPNCGPNCCIDSTSEGNWLFGLEPGPPAKFGPTGTYGDYQRVYAGYWQKWGFLGDLWIGDLDWQPDGALGVRGSCDQGGDYDGMPNQICGGDDNWGETNMEVWYPLTAER